MSCTILLSSLCSDSIVIELPSPLGSNSIIIFLYEQFVEKLSKIGINSKANEIGEGQFETGDYYSRVFVPTPRMVTNRGSLEISGKNIDSVHIIQKG